MTITFLIGNGFDINIGMDTRYCDFYRYYISLPSTNPLIDDLKKDLNDNIDSWADFELQFFTKYSSKLKTLEELDVVFDDVCGELAKFIDLEQSKFELNIADRSQLHKGLGGPEQFLLAADKNEVVHYKNSFTSSSEWIINIISYNYSTSLDQLLNIKSSERISVGLAKSIRINPIRHIHGSTTENMVVGANDPTQFNNELLKNDPDALAAVIKPKCNEIMKHLVDQECRKILDNSNLICLFGLSIGETDKIWWELIGEQLKKDKSRLIIFWKENENEIHPRANSKLERKERKVKTLFLSRANIEQEQWEDIGRKIYIGYNTKIFGIKLKRKSG